MDGDKDKAEKTRQKLEKLKEERLQKENDLRKRGEKLSEKALKMVQKRNAKSFWETWGDPIGYATIGIIVAAIVFLNYTGDRRKLSDIQVNEDTFIQSHNESKDYKYSLGISEYFQGMNLQDLRKMSANEISNKKSFTKCDMQSFKGVNIPSSYNFYEAHPSCDVEEEQKKSSTSYAELPLSVYKNRVCLWNDTENFKPSLNFLVNCNTKLNKGEKGGYMLSTLYFMRKGFVSEQCWEDNVSKEEKDTCPVERLKTCPQKRISAYCHIDGEDNIKREVITNGPVISIIRPYRDFFIYRSGLYEIKDRSKLEGLLFIKIVGWGENAAGLKYWIADTLWGKKWGENGLVNIKMNTEDSLIEKYSFTLYPEEIKLKDDSLDDDENQKDIQKRILAQPISYIESD